MPRSTEGDLVLRNQQRRRAIQIDAERGSGSADDDEPKWRSGPWAGKGFAEKPAEGSRDEGAQGEALSPGVASGPVAKLVGQGDRGTHV